MSSGEAASRPPWAPDLLRALGLMALVFASYAGVHRAELVFDDIWAIRNNPVVNGTLPISEAFLRDFWGKSPSVILTYRPVPVVLSAIEWRLGQGTPVVLHEASVVLHALTVLALYFVWRGLIGETAALAGSALMAVLAAPSEAVFSIYGQADVLAALFALLGLAAHRRSSRAGAVSASLLFALALLSKESALVAPVAWFWLDRTLPTAGRTSRRGRWIAYLTVAVAAFTLRQRVLGSAVPGRGAFGNPLLDAPLLERLLGAGRIFLTKYLRDIAIPTEWQFDCSYAACLPAPPTDLIAWSGLLLAFGVGLLTLYLFWKGRAPRATALLGWAVIFFAPTSNFLVPAPMAYAARWLYQPLLGACLLAGLLACWLADRVPRRSLVWIAWGVLISGNALALRNRQKDWETEEAFYTSGLRQASRSALVRGMLSYWYLTHHRPEEAVEHGRQAVAIAPGYATAHGWIAGGLDDLGQTAEADQEFQTELRLGGTPMSHYAYALFLARHGELRRALDVARAGQQAHGTPAPKLETLIGMLEQDLAKAP